MAVDSFIYFANIRPDYMWCYFGKTVAYVNEVAGADTCSLTFWDTNSNQVGDGYLFILIGIDLVSKTLILLPTQELK